MKYILEFKDGQFVDITFGCESDFIKHVIGCLEASNDDMSRPIGVLKNYLKKCKHQQHVYLIFSDNGVYPHMSLESYIDSLYLL